MFILGAQDANEATSLPVQRHALHRLFHPRAVAVIGASSNPAKVGNRICRQLVAEGFPGELVPVSLRPGEIAGVPARRSLRDHERPVDLAVITTATEQVADGLRDCAAAGVKFAIIHTAGFAELGPEGRALEQELVEIASTCGMRLVGPNCMQIYNAAARLNLIGTPFPAGRIAMISQSGNLVRAAAEEFEMAGLGFSSFVTVGNQADLKVHDYLDYLKDDPQTQVILIYVEGLAPGTGGAFLEIAREAIARKPVVLLKGGVTGAGARSSVSHTGSLAGESRVMSAAMEQAGVVVVDRLDEMVPVADALSRLPLPKGRRVAVVGGGGGHATLCADALEKVGLEVPAFSEATQAMISKHLPPRAGVLNPVDFTGASEREIAVYAKVSEITLAEEADAVLLYGLYAGYRTDLEAPGNTYEDTSRQIVEMVRRMGKPAIMQTVYAYRDHPSLSVLREGNVPVMQSVDHAAAGLAALSRYAEHRSRASRPIWPAIGPIDVLPREFAVRARRRPAVNLAEDESLAVLAAAGIPLVRHRAVEGRSAAAAAAADIGYPVVLKVLHPALVHKSDAGGVDLDLRDEGSLNAAFERMSAATGCNTVLVAAYRPGGLELLVGGYRDATFGAVLVFGLGGTAVEAIDDVTLRVLPIGRDEAATMLTGLRGHRLLGPLRGKPGIDREALIDMFLRVGALLHGTPEIAEIDLNPVLAFPEGALVADARIVLTSNTMDGGT